MKKIISSIAITMFLSGQAMATPLLAQSTDIFTETSSQTSFQGNVQINNQNQSALNPFFQTFIEAVLSSEDYNEKEVEITEIIFENFDDNNIEIIFDGSSSISMTNQTSSDFNTFLNQLQDLTTVTEKTESNITVYKFLFRDFAFTNINDKLVLADDSEYIFQLADQISNSSISLSDNVMVNIDGQFANADFDLTINQNNNQLQYQSETTIQNQNNLSYLNSSTHLYDVLPAQSPIMYFELNNLLDSIQLGATTIDLELNSEINNELSQEFSSELPSYQALLNKQFGILVDNTNQTLPNLTLALDNVSTSEAQEINTLLNELADQLVTESDDTVNITKTSINNELNKLNFTFDPISAANDFGINSIELTYGKLNDTYIISNNAQIITEFQSNSNKLSSVSKFQNSMATDQPATIGNFYFDFPELGQYIENLNQNENTSGTPIESSTIEILEKMNLWSGFSYASDNTIVEEGSLTVPFQELSESLAKSIQNEISNSSNFNYNPYTDVPSDAWFADEVSQAYESYIIDTYDYQAEEFSYEFQPGKEITRGEFIQMIIQAYEIDEQPAQYGSEIFSDVEFGAYYDYAIGIGYEMGIINGDDNANTFRPNDTLNRAEAVQILYNVSPLLNGKFADEDKFIDVADDAWYANVVAVATQEAIVQGINAQEFAPAKKLNKAEAVTLLIRLVNNEVRL
jgi:hypothetical protein